MVSIGSNHLLASTSPGCLPQASLEGQDLAKNIASVPNLKDASNLIALCEPCFDIREWIGIALTLLILGPLFTSVLPWRGVTLIFIARLGLPSIVRLKYPQFMRTNTSEELEICSGAILGLSGSITALILQAHDSRISASLNYHSQLSRHPLLRLLLRTYLYGEMALNGSAQEKDWVASWFRWTHRHINLNKSTELRAKMGLPEHVGLDTSIEDLNAYAFETLIWSTIAFHTKYGAGLSKRARDLIVLQYYCVGLRLGIPEGLLNKDYASFMVSWEHRLDSLASGDHLTHTVVRDLAQFATVARKSWFTDMLIHMAILVGHDLLPQRVREHYDLEILPKHWQKVIQRLLIIVLWIVYPILMWLPLRGLIALFLILEPSLRRPFMMSYRDICSMDILLDKPIFTKSPSYMGKVSIAATADTPLPSYLEWLGSVEDEPSFLQALLVQILTMQLEANLASQWSHKRITLWLSLPLIIFKLALTFAIKTIRGIIGLWSLQIKESMVLTDPNMRIPPHDGYIMDGNHQWVRRLEQPVYYGHMKGVFTNAQLLEWWVRFLPNNPLSCSVSAGPEYITIWALSTENFKRSKEELGDLFIILRIMLRTFAFNPIVHLFKIRIRVIGNRDRLPHELLTAIQLLEQMTSSYTSLNLQVAIDYASKNEFVQTMKQVADLGKDIDEKSIGAETFCRRLGFPTVSTIVRTSE